MDAAACIDVRWWARRTRDFLCVGGRASAFAHPTALCILVESKENRPLFAALGQGVALIPVFSFPLKARGLARHKAHGLDFARPARECVAPGRARIAGPWA